MVDNTEVSITREIVDANTGEYGMAVQWLRQGLNTQRAFLRERRDRAAWWTFNSQATVIVLGFVASLAAIFSKPSPDVWPWGGTQLWALLNVVMPLLISALTAIVALFDFRGSYARNSSAYTAVSAIKSEIDYRVLLSSNGSVSRIDQPMLDDWERRLNAAITQHAQAWERSMSEKKAKD